MPLHEKQCAPKPLCCRFLFPSFSDPAKRITIAGILDHPWFNKDLPHGVKQMNDNMRMPPAGSQTEAQVRGVVTEAQRNTAAQQQNWEDDYIDDTMDAENYDSPYEDDYGVGS